LFVRWATKPAVALAAGSAYMILESVYGPVPGEPWAPLLSVAAAGLAAAGAVCLAAWWLGAGAGLYGWTLKFLLTGLLLIPLATLVLIVALPFGADLLILAPHLEISAEATPPGVWTVHYLRADVASAEDAAPDDPLMHSTYYDPRAIAILGEWIRSQTSARMAGRGAG